MSLYVKMNKSQKAKEIIDYLQSSGKKPDSFSNAFPYIHHFHNKKSGDSSLEGFYSHCSLHELEGVTNLNVLKRLEIIKTKTELFLKDNPEQKISSIKYQRFAKEAVSEVPF